MTDSSLRGTLMIYAEDDGRYVPCTARGEWDGGEFHLLGLASGEYWLGFRNVNEGLGYLTFHIGMGKHKTLAFRIPDPFTVSANVRCNGEPVEGGTGPTTA